MPDTGLLGPKALDAARELLPGWVIWGSFVLYPALAFVLVLALETLAMLMLSSSIRPAEGMHWTKRARPFYLLCAADLIVAWLTMVCVAYLAGAFTSQLSVVPATVVIVLVIAAVEAANFIQWRLAGLRLHLRRLSLPRALKRRTVSAIVHAPVYIAVLMALFLPRRMDAAAIAAIIISSVLLIFCLLGGGVFVLWMLGLARPLADPGLVEASPADKASRSKRERLFRIDVPHANAFANSFLGLITVSEEALEVLSPAQLVAVLYHERAHLRESSKMKLARLAALVWLPVVALWNPLVGAIGEDAWCFLLLLLLGIKIGVRSLMRKAEERADEAARQHAADPATYARALESLYERNLTPAVLNGKLTHPNLYDRMLAAGVQPSYERPEPPGRLSVWFYVVLVLVLVCTRLAQRALMRTDWVERGKRSSVLLALAFHDDTALWLTDLARIESAEEKYERAATFYRAAATIDRGSPYAAAHLSVALSADHKCDEARAALSEAEQRAASWRDEKELKDWLDSARKWLEWCEQ